MRSVHGHRDRLPQGQQLLGPARVAGESQLEGLESAGLPQAASGSEPPACPRKGRSRRRRPGPSRRRRGCRPAAPPGPGAPSAHEASRRTPFSRSLPSSRRSSRQRPSIDSIAATSRPRASREAQVARAASLIRATSRQGRLAPKQRRQAEEADRLRDQGHLDLRDHAERPLRADEEVHEVHPRLGVVAGGALGDVRAWCRSATGTRLASPPSGRPRSSPPGCARHSPPLDVQDVAVREDDGQGSDPLPRGAVLERGRARGVGGHRPPHEGPAEGRGRRVEETVGAKRLLERDEAPRRPRRGRDRLRRVRSRSCARGRERSRRKAWRRR